MHFLPLNQMRMYRSPLDDAADSVLLALYKVKKALSQATLETSHITGGMRAVQHERLTDLCSRLEDEADRLKEEAAHTRNDFATDAAWRMIRLYESGAMEKLDAYHLASLMDSHGQGRLQLPGELSDRMRDSEMRMYLLTQTGFNLL